ncbi:MAG: trypsin-like peptidase domain-containing protein [Oscillospiraceae bacterium]|nr:trypsin-like peptidase domain-containing protein [Oscillospiraceae bacterium]
MENYENEEMQQEQTAWEDVPQEPVQPVYQTSPYQQPYHGTGAGRKESPFANSPYVMQQVQPEAEPYRPQNTYVPPIPPQEPAKPKKQKKAGGKAWKTVLCAVLALAVVAGSCGITAALVNQKWESRTNGMMLSLGKQIDEMQAQIDAFKTYPDTVPAYPQYVTSPGAIYQQNVQSVVLITAEMTTAVFGQTSTATSSGSGFVITEDGYVVTNHHVVDKATKVTITMHDGTEYQAKVIGSDSTNDVALLKIEEDVTLQAVTIGSSTALGVGDQVVAIGNPLGELTSTLTVGYVSAKERDVTTDGTTINMIQTDAAINSGNSGGPLFNSQGEVVGITTAKYSGNSSSGASIEGIGFAIPIDDVMPLVNDLMNYGYINSAYLGVMVSDMDSATASFYGLPTGAYVREVTPGNCAEKAGLQVKDIIVALGEHKVKNVSELTKALRKFKAGEITTITVYRGGAELILDITLDEKPQEEASTETTVPGNGQMPQEGSYDDWYNYFAPFFGDKG